ncbi:unnamed protein product [Mucor hiemalis]
MSFYHPFFTNAFHDMNRAMASFERPNALFNPSFPIHAFGFQSSNMFSSYPNCNLVEKADLFELSAELPGYEKHNISIEMRDVQTMIIRGRQEARSPLPSDGYNADKFNEDRMDITEETQFFAFNFRHWSNERVSRSFSRSFDFPRPVKIDEIKASFKNGILTVIVPKMKQYCSRQINID